MLGAFVTFSLISPCPSSCTELSPLQMKILRLRTEERFKFRWLACTLQQGHRAQGRSRDSAGTTSSQGWLQNCFLQGATCSPALPFGILSPSDPCHPLCHESSEMEGWTAWCCGSLRGRTAHVHVFGDVPAASDPALDLGLTVWG